MAKKTTSAKKSTSPSRAVSTPVSSTPVRNTAIPKIGSAAPASIPAQRKITRDMIAKRAYEIFASGAGGSESDNWFRAERELSAGL